MTLIRRTGSLLALTLLSACASDMLLPKQGLQFSFSRAACGYADGPAVEIYLTRDPSNGNVAVAPYVRVHIEAPANHLDGSIRYVGSGNLDASATYSRAEGEYENAGNGQVKAVYSSSDNAVLGVVDLAFPKAGRLITTFNARLFPNTGLCG